MFTPFLLVVQSVFNHGKISIKHLVITICHVMFTSRKPSSSLQSEQCIKQHIMCKFPVKFTTLYEIFFSSRKQRVLSLIYIPINRYYMSYILDLDKSTVSVITADSLLMTHTIYRLPIESCVQIFFYFFNSCVLIIFYNFPSLL